MNDATQEAGHRGPASVVDPPALVARTPQGWFLAAGDRSASPIDDEALHAWLRASGGERLPADDPTRSVLEAIGVSLPADSAGQDDAGRHRELPAAPGPLPPVGGGVPLVRREDTVEPVAGFLGRVVAGRLLIEGPGGVRTPLDETDLRILEVVRGESTVASVLEQLAERGDAPGPRDEELCTRLRRLVEAGRLSLTVSEPTEPVPTPPDDPDDDGGDLVAAPGMTTGAKAFVRRHRFPGRRYLIRGYRRARRLVAGGATSAPEPTAAPAPPRSRSAERTEVDTVAVARPLDASPDGDEALEVDVDIDLRSEPFLASVLSARRERLPMRAPIRLGAPDYTVASLWDDLQYLIDREIPARFVPAFLGQTTDAGTSGVPDGSDELHAAADAYLAFEHYGILRHVMRAVQWDHGIEATTFLQRIVGVSRDHPDRYPLITWVARHFASFRLVPLGWHSFFEEARRFIVVELDVPLTTALDSVLDLQAFVLPEAGRRFPAALALRHDYVAYHADKTASLSVTGQPAPTPTPLADFGPGTLTVQGDPAGRCTERFVAGGRRAPIGHWELDSPLVRTLALGPGEVRRFTPEQVPATSGP